MRRRVPIPDRFRARLGGALVALAAAACGEPDAVRLAQEAAQAFARGVESGRAAAGAGPGAGAGEAASAPAAAAPAAPAGRGGAAAASCAASTRTPSTRCSSD